MIQPPPTMIKEFGFEWTNWLNTLRDFINNNIYLTFKKSSIGYQVDVEVVHIIDTSSSSLAVLLPKSSDNEGRCYYFKNSGSNVLTIDANLSEAIDGALTLIIGSLGYAKLICDGQNWHRIG